MVEGAPPLAPIVDEIRARCAASGERPPSYVSVQRRIALLFDDLAIAKARTSNARHVRRLKARPGYISAARPLAVCQIDHTPTDIQFVEVIDAVDASGPVTKTSVSVTGLPTNGETIYATLLSMVNGVWQPVYYTYTAAP